MCDEVQLAWEGLDALPAELWTVRGPAALPAQQPARGPPQDPPQAAGDS